MQKAAARVPLLRTLTRLKGIEFVVACRRSTARGDNLSPAVRIYKVSGKLSKTVHLIIPDRGKGRSLQDRDDLSGVRRMYVLKMGTNHGIRTTINAKLGILGSFSLHDMEVPWKVFLPRLTSNKIGLDKY
jgi:hypothetical protein